MYKIPQETFYGELISEEFVMQAIDFFRSRIDAMINLNDPLAVLARPVSGAKLSPEWVEPLNQGLMAVVSANLTTTRLTNEVAMARNNLVAQLATTVLVAHASPGGRLSSLVAQWRLERPQAVVDDFLILKCRK